METRVVKWDPPLAGLPGVQTRAEIVGANDYGFVDPTRAEPESLVVEQPDGSKTLIARSGRHLMVHIYNTLADNDQDLFVDQVLCEATKAEYRDRNLDPRQAFATLKQHERDIHALFDLMPAGEHTPGVFWEPVGTVGPDNQRVVRIKVTGVGTTRLHWTFMDMVMEHGNWRLRWFGR